MSRVDELPADQRATLALLLRQRKTYTQVADMLGIPERAVHDRAHAALAILAPGEARPLDAQRRREIGDYLLGQQGSVGERMRTRTMLAGTPAANAWASAIAGELSGLTDATLPEIPAPDGAQEPYPPPEASSPSGGALAGARSAPSSRRGGAVLLAVLAVAVIVAVVVIVSNDSSNSNSAAKQPGRAATASSSGPKQEGRISLQAPPGSASKGTVEILSEAGKRAFYIQAERLPQTQGFFYAVWLYNSPTSALPLSKSPPVGASHRLAGAALLPSNAASYHEIILTRETSTRPKHPGPVALRGPLSLSG